MLLGRKIMIGVLAAGMSVAAASVTLFALNDKGVINLHQDELREYNAQFYSEGSLVYETGQIKKGTKINYGYTDFPTKRRTPDGKVYQCIGWDITGEGLPDIVPTRIYGDFKANAVFIRLPTIEKLLMDPDLVAKLADLLQQLNVQLSPEQVQNILNWLMDLGIDWESIDLSVLEQIFNLLNIDLEQFMDMTGLDLEGLMAILARPMFKYTASNAGGFYFRNQSFGNSYSNNTWAKADYYNPAHISSGSVNPMDYAADKIAHSGLISPTNFSLTYVNEGEVYPVPCHELNNAQGLASDAYSLTSPTQIQPIEDYKYSAQYNTNALGFIPACTKVASILSIMDFSSDAIKQDELEYRNYAREHYLEVDEKYRSLFSSIAAERNIEVDATYNFLSQILTFFSENYHFNYEMKAYPAGEDKILYFMNEAHEGIGTHFADATTMFFRTLGVPARTVSGYVDVAENAFEERTVTGIQAHNWTEIYLNGIGWLSFDAVLADSVIPPEYSQYLFNSFDTIDPEMGGDTYQDLSIEASKEYFVGDSFDYSDLKYYVTTETGEVKEVQYEDLTYVSMPNMYVQGEQEITAILVQGTNVLTATTTITVNEIKPVDMVIYPTSDVTSCMINTVYNVVPDGMVYYNNGTEMPLSLFGVTYEQPDTSEAGIQQVEFVLNGYPDVTYTLDVEIVAPTDFNFSEDSIHTTYLVGSEFWGNPSGIVTLSNGNTYRTFDLDYIEPDMDTPGTYEMTFVVQEYPYLYDTCEVRILAEPEAPLSAVYGGYVIEVIPNTELENLDISLIAYYEDGTYRTVNKSNGDIYFGNYDLSTQGTHIVPVYYEEGGIVKSTTITVEVKGRVSVNINCDYKDKEYDSQELYISESDLSFDSMYALEGQYTVVTNIVEPVSTNTIDAGDYYYVYFFKIYNGDGEDITDEYGRNSMLKFVLNGELLTNNFDYLYDSENEQFILIKSYTIEQREINVYTTTLENVSSDEDLATRYRECWSDNLAPGDYIDTSSVVWTAHVNPGGQSENTIDITQLVIRNSNGDDVTSNYHINFEPGIITYGGGA